MLRPDELIAPHTGATMSIPHYINENKSDMRGIKPGWYAMEDDGKLSSGPFPSREECLKTGAVTTTAEVKKIHPTIDRR
jgi:hypothetical protein